MKSLIATFTLLLLLSGQLDLQAKPKKKEGTNDPEANFEELWQTFHKRYAFFELREVDWKKQYEIFWPKVTKGTTDEELFSILCEMLAPLKDGHIKLKAREARGIPVHEEVLSSKADIKKGIDPVLQAALADLTRRPKEPRSLHAPDLALAHPRIARNPKPANAK